MPNCRRPARLRVSCGHMNEANQPATVSLRRDARGGIPWTLFAAAALAIAGTTTLLSAPRTYEDRLVDLAARKALPQALYSSSAGDTRLQAELLDLQSDRELAFELRLAAEKYGAAGEKVVGLYATDPLFQEALRAYGDGIVPVVVYFMENDIRSLSALAWAKGKLGMYRETPYASFGVSARGQHAIEVIARDGHRFLGQFAVDASGRAHWNQTERTLQVLMAFLAGGLRNLESKHDLGEDIGALDVLSASADVFVPIATVKALKLFSAARATGATGTATAARAGSRGVVAQGDGLVLRTRMLGAHVLQTSRVGRAALKLGLVASTAYLVVRHPSLLNSFFEAAARAVGVPEWLGKFVGWALVALPLLMIVGPLLTLTSFLVPVIRGLVWLGRWLAPRGRRSQSRDQPRGA